MDALTSDSHLDAVVVPIGGGGLIAGISVVMKHLLPNVEVIVSIQEDCLQVFNVWTNKQVVIRWKYMML